MNSILPKLCFLTCPDPLPLLRSKSDIEERKKGSRAYFLRGFWPWALFHIQHLHYEHVAPNLSRALD